MSRKGSSKVLCIFLTLLALFLVGTVVVLSTVVHYFGVDWHDVITDQEMARFERLAAQAAKLNNNPLTNIPAYDELAAATTEATVEDDELWSGVPGRDEFEQSGGLDYRALTNNTTQPRIPKIIHQTWINDTLPAKWAPVRETCAILHPDYEYMLWTDALSREFIAKEYPWFLQTFDNYPYPIQRADAIRYFVLHYYGGVYMDIDIGCNRSMDPLLYFQVVLPATIPVGVSNDLMMAEKGHPFMELVIHNLITFDHSYGSNYPTVMFSTGPMFVSAQYGLWPKEDPDGTEERQVRILPRKWYGKNAPLAEQATSYFAHFYGSSWHADDAGFITFLGKFGVALMYLGLAVVVLGGARLLWSKRSMLKTGAIRPVGAIQLPFHADGSSRSRPETPGSSRPNSPFNPYRSASPTSDIGTHHPRGVLYYLPVWLMSPGDRPGSSGPLSPGGAGWTSYLPGMGGDESEGYQAVPHFSRPHSPNNSILHGSAQHDGAFDGVALRTMSPNGAEVYKDHASPAPPAYSALRSWGSSLFRSVPAGGAQPPSEPATPLLAKGGNRDTTTPQEGLKRGAPRREPPPARDGTPLGLGLEHRSGSPLAGHPVAPPGYAGSAGRAGPRSASPASDSGGQGRRAGAGGRGDGEAAPQGEDGHRQPRGGPGLAHRAGEGRGRSDDEAEEDAGWGDEAGGAREEDEWEGGRGGGGQVDLDEYERAVGGSGGGLEEEVDRLLEEMAPDFVRTE